MPINNNVGCLNAYDKDDNIPIEKLGGVSNPSLHHTVHCLAFEILRGWTAFSLSAYNAMGEPEPYQSTRARIISDALIRISQNPRTAEESSLLTDSDKEIAAMQGESYYEQGYVKMFASVDPSAKLGLQRTVGVN